MNRRLPPTNPADILITEAAGPACLDPDQDHRARLRERLFDLAWSLLVTALCAVAFALTPVTAQASTTVEVRDGDTTVLKVSTLDQTRLRVENGRMLEVVGDVYDPEKNPQGRLVVLRDDEAGEFYVRPVLASSGVPTQPVKLDVKTSLGTVGLLLTPAATVGHTVTLRVVGGPNRLVGTGPAARAAPHPRAIKALVLAMASPDLTSPVPVRHLPAGGERVSLWAEAQFVLLAVHQAPGMDGEVYRLTNVSAEPMVLDEREFYRPGVLAVSIQHLQLARGQATPVWVVRATGRPD